MNKIKLLIAAVTIMGGTLIYIPQAIASQTIEGESNAQIHVEGTIGEFDSTNPGPNPEDKDKWINVKLPTTAIFYSKDSDKTELTSPEYEIINNSARGVTVNVARIDNPLDIELIDSLNIGNIEFISDGEVSLVSEKTLFTLSNNQSETMSYRVGAFQFTGVALGANDVEEVNPSFNVVFKFIPSEE